MTDEWSERIASHKASSRLLWQSCLAGGGARALVAVPVGVILILAITACETLPVDSEILDALAPACEGQGVQQASPYREGPRPAPMVILNTEDPESAVPSRLTEMASRELLKELPTNWLPTAVSDAQLVACQTTQELPTDITCAYGVRGGIQVPLVRFESEIRLVEARTGKLVASERFYGSSECPRAIRVGTRRVLGDFVQFEDVEAWLREYVMLEE